MIYVFYKTSKKNKLSWSHFVFSQVMTDDVTGEMHEGQPIAVCVVDTFYKNTKILSLTLCQHSAESRGLLQVLWFPPTGKVDRVGY